MTNGGGTATGIGGTGILHSVLGSANGTVTVTRIVAQGHLGPGLTAGNGKVVLSSGVTSTASVYNVRGTPIWRTFIQGNVSATAGLGTVVAMGFNFKHYLHPYIYNQIPEYIREQNPTFVAFLEAYYRYLDSAGKVNDILLNSGSWTDVDNTLDAFVEKLRSQFAWDFPNTTIVDARRFVKIVHEFYESKGTEQSIEMFFRMLYQDEVRVDYPSKVILRASDGRWKRDISLKLDVTGYSGNLLYVYYDQGYSVDQGTDRGYVYQIGNNTDPYDLIGKKVTVRYWENVIGVGMVHQFFVTSIIDVKKTLNPMIYDLIVDIDPTTQILDGATVEFNTNVYGLLTRQLLTYTVINPGTNFFPGDVLYINQLGQSGEYFQQDYSVGLGTVAGYVLGNALNNGILRCATTDVAKGIATVTILNTGYLFTSSTFQIDVSSTKSTSPATLEFTTGFIYQHPGIFTDASGLLSDACRLQDNYYYQPYSYVIKTKIDPTIWKDAYIRAVHPAGIKMFSEFIIEDYADLRSLTYATDDTRDTLHGLVSGFFTGEELHWLFSKTLPVDLVHSDDINWYYHLDKTLTTDSVSQSDSVAKLVNKVVADTTSHSDVFDRVVDYVRPTGLPGDYGWTDTPVTSQIVTKDVGKALTDTFTKSDVAAIFFAKSLTDNVTQGEVFTRTFNKALTDVVTKGDSVTFSVSKALSDIAHPTEALVRVTGKVMADTAHPTEALTKAMSVIMTSDTAHPTDSALVTLLKGLTAEIAHTAEVLTYIMNYNKSYTDTAHPTDSLAKAVSTTLVTDNAHPTDARTLSVTKVFADTVVTSDTFLNAVTHPFANDPATTSDVMTRFIGKNPIDNAHPTEVLTKALSTIVGTDNVHPTDSPAKAFGKPLSDSVLQGDNLTYVMNYRNVLSDVAHPTDSFARTVTFTRTFTEVQTSSDVFTRVVVFARTFSDSVAKGDSSSINMAKVPTLETVTTSSSGGLAIDYVDPTYFSAPSITQFYVGDITSF